MNEMELLLRRLEETKEHYYQACGAYDVIALVYRELKNRYLAADTRLQNAHEVYRQALSAIAEHTEQLKGA